MIEVKNDRGFVNVDSLIKEIEAVGKRCSGFNVICWLPEDITCEIVGVKTDKNGDICLWIEEKIEDPGGYDVETLFDVLKGSKKGARVYLATEGAYFGFEVNHNGDIFSDPDDEDESIGFYAFEIGAYDVDISHDSQMTPMTQTTKESSILTIVLVLISTLPVGLLCHNIVKLLTHSGQHVWENILWVVVCAILIVIDAMTLIHSNDGT